MEHPDEFRKLLKQVMNQTPLPKEDQELIARAVHEIEVLQLLGDRYVVWLN